MDGVKVDRATKTGVASFVLIVVSLLLLWSGWASGKPHHVVHSTNGAGIEVGFGVTLLDCKRDRTLVGFPSRDCAAGWEKRLDDRHSSFIGSAVTGSLGLLLAAVVIKRSGPHKPQPPRVVDWG